MPLSQRGTPTGRGRHSSLMRELGSLPTKTPNMCVAGGAHQTPWTRGRMPSPAPWVRQRSRHSRNVGWAIPTALRSREIARPACTVLPVEQEPGDTTGAEQQRVCRHQRPQSQEHRVHFQPAVNIPVFTTDEDSASAKCHRTRQSAVSWSSGLHCPSRFPL